MKFYTLLSYLFLAFIVVLFGSCQKPMPDTELYRVAEVSLTARHPGQNPYKDGPVVSAWVKGVSGEAQGLEFRVHGFWDGGNIWKLRFAPVKEGKWEYRTESADRGLNNKKGSFIAIKPTPEHLSSNILYHGFLEKADTFSWKLSDGIPFFPVGDTQWSFSEEFTFPEWKEWMNALADRHYNTFMGCCWLGKYTRVGLIPFANRNPASDTLMVRFFQEQLDSMVLYANNKGIMMGLVIGGFPDNSQWFRRFGTIERGDRWFRYIVARYSAFNVRWGLFGELDEAVGKNRLEEKSWQWAGSHYAALVKEYDPYKHPVGSHNTRVDFNAAADNNIDYIKVQEGDRKSDQQYLNAVSLRKWKKPVWYEEYWYEMDGDQNVGIRNTHRNFIHALAFPTMGSLMRNHAGINSPFPPEEARIQRISLYDYLMKNDTGMIRTGYFADFYQPLINDLKNFVPDGKLVNRGECGRFGDHFAVFVEGGGDCILDLSGVKGQFAVKCLNIRTGEVKDLGSVSGGASVIIDTQMKSDVCVLLLKLFE